ncbi:MAG: hypothetical protein WCC63_00520 [Candidatus Bathyarchaeia archaeon]
MSRKWQGLPKLAAIVGGFLIMMGILLLGITALALAGYLDMGLLLERGYFLAFAAVMMAVGLLDIFSAVVIARW